jgi:hypothetical protein
MGAVSAHAAEGGYSSYAPGTYGDFALAVAPPPGFTIRNDVYYYETEGGRSVRSGRLEVEVELSFFFNFLALLYKTDFKILGGQYAFGTFIPFALNLDLDTRILSGGLERRVQDDTSGLGDVIFIPIVLYWNLDNFHYSFSQSIIAPTGDYSTDNLVNASLNYWTFDTDVAVTYLNPETGQDYSVNIGHNYNTENTDTDYQTGQELHIDCMFNQFLSESWAVGINGFYYKQITGDSGDGAILGDFKAEAAGIGPAILWSTKIADQDVSFIAKWLHEFHAENRLEGDHVFLSFAMSF